MRRQSQQRRSTALTPNPKLAEFIANLLVLFLLVRSTHKKAVTMVTQGSRGTFKPGSQDQSTNLTIGSAHKRLHNTKRGGFTAYGENGQFTTINNESNNKIPLREVPRRYSVGAKHDDRGITVQVNINVESQERIDNCPIWPEGSLRPEH
jgi:hypothetical protein